MRSFWTVVVDITSDDTGRSAVASRKFYRAWGGARRNQDVFSFHGRAARQEKLSQLGRVEFLVLARVQAEKNLATGIEMALEVVEKEGPLGRSPPPIALTFAVEIDRERGDQIELSAEIGKWLERLDRPNAALDPEKIEQLGEERELIDVQAEAGVPEVLKHEEKKSAPATEIEDRLRRRAVQFQILSANNV